MQASQRLIDLLNLPVGALRSMGEELGTQFSAGATKWDMARALAPAKRLDLEAESNGFLYAGRTSLSWLRFVPLDLDIDDGEPRHFYPLDGEALEDGDIRRALEAHSEGDPFSEMSRPVEITSQPKLVVAHDRDDDYLIRFAVAKRAGHVIHNFKVQEVLEDVFFAGVLRPGDGSFEVRSSAVQAGRLNKAWLLDFAEDLGMQTVPVEITEADVRALRDAIGGRLDVFRGRDGSGTSIFEARQFEKAPRVHDLYEEKEFGHEVNGLEPIAYDLLFNRNGIEDIRVHVSTLKGSVFVRKAVPEEVLRYIYDALREIKSP